MDVPCNTVIQNLVLTFEDPRSCIFSEKTRERGGEFHLKRVFQINITGPLHLPGVSHCREHNVCVVNPQRRENSVTKNQLNLP